jgi:glycosyltransferase involved in cell wall biosynthesis
MRAHRQFLLADYSSRALKAIDSDLARVTERRERGTVVIHAHDLNTLVPGARAKARFGARLVYDSHELQLGTTGMMSRSRPHRWLYKIYERSLARRADAVITVCESIAEILERGYGIPHVDVVRNCPLLVPPLDRHDLFRREQGIPPQQKIALYHGNLSPGRGLEVLVQSAQFMPETHVVLLGSGPLFDELPKIAEHYGVSETVHVLPAVRQTVLHRYVASADVAVVPIQGAIPNYYYSLPNKLFEALMAGLPIAASHLPEIRRVVEDERVGAIFDPDDPQDVARGITDVLTAADYQAMRERAVVAARERHHWGREVERLSAVYDRLAATA